MIEPIHSSAWLREIGVELPPAKPKARAPRVGWSMWEHLCGYPSMYVELIRKLRGAGLIPSRTHRVLDCSGPNHLLGRSYARVCSGLSQIESPGPDGADRFDVAMCAQGLRHAQASRAAVAGMSRALRPDGLLLLITGRSSDAYEVLSWLWESGVTPLGCMEIGRPWQIGHCLSRAVLGVKIEPA